MSFPLRQLRPADFPPLLQEVPDKPSSLYIRGELPEPTLKRLCVVGSRACSVYARRETARLIAGLAQHRVAILSGLALGIDAEAHKAALDAGLPTVAILPSSCDDSSIYPSTNRALAQRILLSGGALISEHAPKHKPRLFDFPGRNRIMAGMSDAVLIAEASEKSGTLITARLAMDYNREVLAVPHEIGKVSGAGGNRLIREGAALVRDSADILEVLGLKTSEKPEQLALPSDLTPEETALLQVLSEAYARDELIDESGLSAQETNVALSSLLIRGLIVERLGKIERV